MLASPPQQIQQAALAAGAVAGAAVRPLQHQVEVGHQLGAVGFGLQGVEGTAVNERFEGAAVQLLGGQPVAEIGEAGEGALQATGFNQLADGPFAQVADSR